MDRISLKLLEIMQLRQIAFSGAYSPRIAKRAYIILKNAGELTSNEVVGVPYNIDRRTESRWCRRYLDHGFVCLLQDAPRPGRPWRSSPSYEELMDALMNRSPPDTVSWTYREMADELHTYPSVIWKMARQYNIPLSRSGLMMKLQSKYNYAISSIEGLFLSPTFKAVAFQLESNLKKEATQYSRIINSGTTPGNHECERTHMVECVSPAQIGSQSKVNLIMTRTDRPDKVTRLQISIPQLVQKPSKSEDINSFQTDISDKIIAFYYYKSIELNEMIKRVIGDLNPIECEHSFDMDFLIFLDLVRRAVPAEKEISLIMNPLGDDNNDRISGWLKKNPRFHHSLFADDQLWLNIVFESINSIEDRYKQFISHQMEYYMLKINDRHFTNKNDHLIIIWNDNQ